MKRYLKPLSILSIIILSACSHAAQSGTDKAESVNTDYPTATLEGQWVSTDNNSIPIIDFVDESTVVLNGKDTDRYFTKYERDADNVSIKPEIFQGKLLLKVVNSDTITGSSINGTWIKQK